MGFGFNCCRICSGADALLGLDVVHGALVIWQACIINRSFKKKKSLGSQAVQEYEKKSYGPVA